jgi:hypothetical protein
MTRKKWNWQKDDWGNFTYDNSEIEKLEREYSRQSGFSLGIAQLLASPFVSKVLAKVGKPFTLTVAI